MCHEKTHEFLESNFLCLRPDLDSGPYARIFDSEWPSGISGCRRKHCIPYLHTV